MLWKKLKKKKKPTNQMEVRITDIINTLKKKKILNKKFIKIKFFFLLLN